MFDFVSPSSSSSSSSLPTSRHSIASCLQRYIKTMLLSVSGLKALILDKDTTKVISLVTSQSQILDRDVFLVERIDAEPSEDQMKHLNVIYFIRPTPDNFLRLIKDLKKPRFKEYHLFFSNTVPISQIERLGKCDEKEVIHQVQEYYADVLCINPSLFGLDMPSVSLSMTLPYVSWTAYQQSQFTRIVQGLISGLLCSIRHRLVGIHFPKFSEFSHRLAIEVDSQLSLQSEMLVKAIASHSGKTHFAERQPSDNSSSISSFSGPHSGCVIVIFDRRDDPITPLLNQWTYQSMIHELIGIEDNKVKIQTTTGGFEKMNGGTDMDQLNGAENRAKSSDIVLSCLNDPFFEAHRNSNFGELGMAINEYVKSYQSKLKLTSKVESIEDMQRFVELYPEFRKLSGNVSKHVAIAHELNRLVVANSLLDISQIEQSVACSVNRTEHLKLTLDRLRTSTVSRFDKLRLVLLYAIKYEKDPYIKNLKDELRKSSLEEEQVRLVDAVIEYAGIDSRGTDFSQSSNLLQLAKNAVQRGLKGIPNVYTQHRSILYSVVEMAAKGRLKDSSYSFLPFTELSFVDNKEFNQRGSSGGIQHKAQVDYTLNSNNQTRIGAIRHIPLVNSSPFYSSGGLGMGERPAEILVFVVGGATFEEARDVDDLAKQHQIDITLGGTTMHNSKSFLADVSQLKRSAVNGW